MQKRHPASAGWRLKRRAELLLGDDRGEGVVGAAAGPLDGAVLELLGPAGLILILGLRSNREAQLLVQADVGQPLVGNLAPRRSATGVLVPG